MAWNAAVVAAGVQAGAGAIGTGMGVAGTLKANREARDYNFGMYNEEWRRQMEAWNMQNQRDDATWNRQNEYNQQLWNQQNAYNSPLAQMQRYKEAGLNPNLIYGQSNTGGSIATSNLESGKLEGNQAKPYHPQTPDYSGFGKALGDGLMSYLAFRQNGAQVDNLKAQNQVLQQESALKAAQTASTLMSTVGTDLGNQRSKLLLDTEGELRKTQIDAAVANIRKANIDADISLRQDERQAISQDQSIRESAVRILKMRGEIDATQAGKLLTDATRGNVVMDARTKAIDQGLKSLELKFKKEGQPATDVINRTLGELLKDVPRKAAEWWHNQPSGDERRKQFYRLNR